jgi:hypothetical protein
VEQELLTRPENMSSPPVLVEFVLLDLLCVCFVVSSYKPITNTAWFGATLCKLQKGCTRLAAASDKAYQLLAHGRWFSPGTPASSTIKTGRHDIAEILLKVALNTTSGAGTAYPSRKHEFTSGFSGVRATRSFMCMFCRSLFILLSFFFWLI